MIYLSKCFCTTPFASPKGKYHLSFDSEFTSKFPKIPLRNYWALKKTDIVVETNRKCYRPTNILSHKGSSAFTLCCSSFFTQVVKIRRKIFPICSTGILVLIHEISIVLFLLEFVLKTPVFCPFCEFKEDIFFKNLRASAFDQ